MRLIQKIESLGVSLAVDGNDLVIKGNTRALTRDQIEWMKKNKVEIMARLRNLKPLDQSEEKAIRSWLAYIEETDMELINEVITRCERDMEARRYFLSRSDEVLKETANLRRQKCTA